MGGKTAWLVLGETESGDRLNWVLDHEPSVADLLDLVRECGDDAGVAGSVTPGDLDEHGYLLDEDAHAIEGEYGPEYPGPGFGGSYVHLSVEPAEMRS